MKEIVNPTRLKCPLDLLNNKLAPINKWAKSPNKFTPPTQEECHALHNAIIIYAKHIVPSTKKRLLVDALETIKRRKKTIYSKINDALLDAKSSLKYDIPSGLEVPYLEKLMRIYVMRIDNDEAKGKDALDFLNKIKRYKKSILSNNVKNNDYKDLIININIINNYKSYRKIKSSDNEMLLISEMIIEQLLWSPYKNIYSLLVYSGYIPDRENLWPSIELQKKWRSRVSATNRQRKCRGKSLINC